MFFLFNQYGLIEQVHIANDKEHKTYSGFHKKVAEMDEKLKNPPYLYTEFIYRHPKEKTKYQEQLCMLRLYDLILYMLLENEEHKNMTK